MGKAQGHGWDMSGTWGTCARLKWHRADSKDLGGRLGGHRQDSGDMGRLWGLGGHDWVQKVAILMHIRQISGCVCLSECACECLFDDLINDFYLSGTLVFYRAWLCTRAPTEHLGGSSRMNFYLKPECCFYYYYYYYYWWSDVRL